MLFRSKDFRFIGDARLVQDVQDADPAAMLRATEKLRVVTHAPSRNYCRHQGRAAAECARDRPPGLLQLGRAPWRGKRGDLGGRLSLKKQPKRPCQKPP